MDANATASDASTLTEILDALSDDGYTSTFVADDDGVVVCRTCQRQVGPEDLPVEGLRRVEGASDPADMAVVLAVRCPACDAAGSIVVRYGPEATAGDAALLAQIDFRHATPLDAAERASAHEPPTPAPPGGR